MLLNYVFNYSWTSGPVDEPGVKQMQIYGWNHLRGQAIHLELLKSKLESFKLNVFICIHKHEDNTKACTGR